MAPTTRTSLASYAAVPARTRDTAGSPTRPGRVACPTWRKADLRNLFDPALRERGPHFGVPRAPSRIRIAALRRSLARIGRSSAGHGRILQSHAANHRHGWLLRGDFHPQ